MFTKAERLISIRNLRPKKKEGFLKIISIFSFLGIMLGVAILIIVMSVMNGFKTDLTKKILGLNPHIVIQPNSFIIDDDYILKIKENLIKAEKIYHNLKKQNIDVLLDDVDENMSNKFKKHDLIGIPYQIIIGSKSEGDRFEFKELNSESAILSLEDIKSKSNASSEPINTFFLLNFFTSPLTIFFSKNSFIFFSVLLTPLKIIPFA